jgi:hypothetical protein
VRVALRLLCGAHRRVYLNANDELYSTVGFNLWYAYPWGDEKSS